MTSILDTISSFLTPAITGAAATHLGESEGGVAKATKGLAATILAGMAGKANDANALSSLFGALSDKQNVNFLSNLAGLIGGGNLANNDPKDIAGRLVGSIFGDKTGGILNAITSFGGLKPGSASSLLGLAGPLVMGVLGKRIAGDNLNADGLKRLLLSEADTFRKAAPSGVSDLLGFAKVADIRPETHARPVERATVAAASTAAAATAAASRGGVPAWVWAVPVVLGVGLIGWTMMGRNKTKTVETAAVETSAPATTAAEPAITEPSTTIAEATPAEPAVVEPQPTETPVIASIEPATPATEFVKDLGGVQLRGAAGGIEEKLVSFIESNQAPCTDPACWFSFDRLTFATGSAEIDMAKSADQIANMAAILKAFPGIQIKIGGYTDNTGSQEMNMKLSQARAEAVAKAVAALGVDAARLDAEGYGPQHPVASNDTEEGRSQNRRIDVRVKARS